MYPGHEKLNLHPVARIMSTVFGVVGALFADNIFTLMVGLCVCMLPLILLTGIIKPFFRFISMFVLPIGLALLFVWGWLVAAAPGEPLGSSPVMGADYAAVITLRLAVLGGIGQLCLMTIKPRDLPATLRMLGFRGDGLVIALASFALVPEIRLRIDQVITARYARGLMPNRKIFTRLKQIPYILRPLLAWVLRSALQRSEAWHQRALCFDALGSKLSVSPVKSVAVSTFALLWMSAAILLRW